MKAEGAHPEDLHEHRAVNLFRVPPEACWAYLKSLAPQPTIGQLIDDERDGARDLPACGSRAA